MRAVAGIAFDGPPPPRSPNNFNMLLGPCVPGHDEHTANTINRVRYEFALTGY